MCMTAIQQTIQTFTHYILLGIKDNNEDNIFSGSVVYICDHTEEGALGLILNKEIDLKMLDLFKKLDLEISPEFTSNITNKNISIGGPSEPERGFVLHNKIEAEYSSSITRELSVTTSLDVLEEIAN